MRKDFVEKEDILIVNDIDKDCKNKWLWTWLEKSADIVEGVKCADFIRKLPFAGLAYCTWCMSEINYASRGWLALKSHACCKKHRGCMTTRKTNFRLSGTSRYV